MDFTNLFITFLLFFSPYYSYLFITRCSCGPLILNEIFKFIPLKQGVNVLIFVFCQSIFHCLKYINNANAYIVTIYNSCNFWSINY